MSTGRTARRLVTLPLVLGWHTLVVLTLPLTLLAAVVVSLVAGSSRPLRTVVLLAAWSALELVTVLRVVNLRRQTQEAGGRSDLDAQWQALIRWVLVRGYAVISRVLDLRVRLEDGSATPGETERCEGGVIVLARHCGPGDTFLIAWLLAVHYRLRLRVVLKSLLRVIPAIDLAGDALPFCFVGARRGAARTGIAKLAASLDVGDALLLFPEGANYSRKRWIEQMRKVAHSGEALRARRLRRNEHTLPPRTGGFTAAVGAAPSAAVLLLAHTGLSDDGRDRPWWQLPVHRDLVVRTLLVPPDRVPQAADLPPWLDQEWTRVDTWIEARAALEASA